MQISFTAQTAPPKLSLPPRRGLKLVWCHPLTRVHFFGFIFIHSSIQFHFYLKKEECFLLLFVFQLRHHSICLWLNAKSLLIELRSAPLASAAELLSCSAHTQNSISQVLSNGGWKEKDCIRKLWQNFFPIFFADFFSSIIDYNLRNYIEDDWQQDRSLIFDYSFWNFI